MRRFFALLMACGLVASLGACAVVDLTAHAVKEVEKSRRGDGSAVASASSTPARSSSSSEVEEPPPPQTAPAPRKSSVTAEELPPQ